MKISGRTEKWLSGILGIVCLLLVANLALEWGGGRVGASRPAARGARAALAASGKGGDELANYDPALRLGLLKEIESRPRPRLARNPFTSGVPKPVEPVTTAPPPPAPPPPPPPIPLKPVGYSEKAQGPREAYVSDDEQVYVVHEGEEFAKKYKVLKITPKFVEVEDETTHQTAQLPFPQ